MVTQLRRKGFGEVTRWGEEEGSVRPDGVAGMGGGGRRGTSINQAQKVLEVSQSQAYTRCWEKEGLPTV